MLFFKSSILVLLFWTIYLKLGNQVLKLFSVIPGYLKRRVLYCTGADEGDDDCDDVDSQLKLEKLGDAVVHVTAPHDSLHDAAKVVVSQDNVGSLLCHIGTGNALKSNDKKSFLFIFTR